MDAQLKRGFLDICVLAAVKNEDSYGYKILKDVPKALELTESTLYPVLKRLEAAGCLAEYTVEYNSRLRKYYKITQQGLERIQKFSEERKCVLEIYDYIQRGKSNDQK